MIQWLDIHYGDRVLIDLSADVLAKNYGFPDAAWGRVINTHSLGELGLAMEDLPIPKHLTTPCAPSGFVFHLSAVDLGRVLKHEPAV